MAKDAEDIDIETSAGIADDVQVTIKGPDPAVWGEHEDRLAADIAAGKTDGVNEQLQAMIEAGEHPILELEDGTVIKGPDPAIWS